MSRSLFLPLCASVLLCLGCSQNSPRIVEDFNFDWRFTLGDNPKFADVDFDDASWRELHLPHDWSIEGEFSADNPSTPGGGALPGGIGWYRKHFTTPQISRDYQGNPAKKVLIEFDGVFMNSTVYVNGIDCGTRPYGYSSFQYDITDCLNYDGSGDNVIAVRCDNEDLPNSRWYAGCGIYRNVRLLTVSAAHIAYNGIWAKPLSATKEEAVFAVETTLDTPGSTILEVRNQIFDAKGHRVSKGGDTLKIKKPHLWSPDDPYLYTLRTSVHYAGKELDRVETKIGVRDIRFDPEKGFFLNGENMKMKGVCLHHDMGCIGTAVHMAALRRELGILKGMGCNAIRTSHNPPAPELLELCDEMGFLVFDEAMDMWRRRKTQFDYARFFDTWHERDVQDFVRRDRNHPSIVMWSVGNEILEQWDTNGGDLGDKDPARANLLLNFISSLPQYHSGDNFSITLARHMAALIRELDDTRPISSGCNESKPYNNLFLSGALDTYGINYHTCDYDSLRTWYPDKPLYGSETCSAINSRGWYPQPSTGQYVLPKTWDSFYDTPHHQCSAYDNCRVPWGDFHEKGWIDIRDREYMFGTFVWTGFDYLGEPTPYGWPSRSSYFGIVDLAGFPKDVYWMYQSEWTNKTVLHLFPHWNWKDGDKVDLWAYYSNADEVELRLNGRSLGRSHKEGSRLHAQWLGVPFEKGILEAISYRGGVEVARDRHVTSGAPASLKLTPDRRKLSSDGYDLCYVTVEALDCEGNIVPDASTMLHFEVSGEGELFGVDNGNAADTLSLKGSDKALFAGKALAVVRSIRGAAGKAVLKVSSSVGSSTLAIEVE